MHPPKTCTFECIYCQLGRTVNKVSKPEEVKTLINKERVIEELKLTLKRVDLGSIDYITFSGTGEPTLNLMIGEMVSEIRSLLKEKCPPIAILTNSSLIFRDDVAENLCSFDLVMAKLDAPYEELFERINRPAQDIRLSKIINGLKRFRRRYRGKLVAQIMLLRDQSLNIDNTKRDIVEGLVELVEEVKFDEVYLNTPWRPPLVSTIKPLNVNELEDIAKHFLKVLSENRIHYFKGVHDVKPCYVEKLNENEVLSLLKRRPCRFYDIIAVFNIRDPSSLKELSRILDQLKEKGLIDIIRYQGETYYKGI